FRLRGNQSLEFIQQQFASVIDRCYTQPCTALFAEHLPRNDVGMMLHCGDQNLVTALDELPPETGSNQIDCLGRTSHKENLSRLGSTHKALRPEAALLVIIGGPFA